MRRRLFDGPDQGLGEQIQLLEQLAGVRGAQGRCSLVATLQAALRACGQEFAYSHLMGCCGAAFMLRIEPEFPARLALEGREDGVVPALHELGHRAQMLNQPPPQRTLALIRQEIAAKRPLLAFGWGENSSEWSLIVGTQAEDLLGFGFGGGSLLRRSPEVEKLLTLGKPIAVAPPRQAALVALARALALLLVNQSQYGAWLLSLELNEPYGAPLSRLERFLGEQWLSQCLLDARDAAAEYLSACLDFLPEDAAERVAEAAEQCARLADVAESLIADPELIAPAALFEDLDWRQQRRDTIRRLRELESEIHHLLRQALLLAGEDV